MGCTVFYIMLRILTKYTFNPDYQLVTDFVNFCLKVFSMSNAILTGFKAMLKVVFPIAFNIRYTLRLSFML